MQSERPQDLITSSKAASILGVHPHTVVRWVVAGRLRGWKVGGRYRVSESDVRAMTQPVRLDVPPRERTAEEMRAGSEAARERLRRMGVKV